jgi:outer membrane protein assembly factor BamB
MFRLTGGAAVDEASSPAVGTDGTIYVGEELWDGEPDAVILALNPNGTLKWEVHYGSAPTAISVGGDGTIYFGSGSQGPPSLYALNPDGTLKWQYDEPEGGAVRTPAATARARKDGLLAP